MLWAVAPPDEVLWEEGPEYTPVSKRLIGLNPFALRGRRRYPTPRRDDNKDEFAVRFVVNDLPAAVNPPAVAAAVVVLVPPLAKPGVEPADRRADAINFPPGVDIRPRTSRNVGLDLDALLSIWNAGLVALPTLNLSPAAGVLPALAVLAEAAVDPAVKALYGEVAKDVVPPMRTVLVAGVLAKGF